MGKDYLIAADLEGIHGIVGEPYKSLYPDVADYAKAIENAVKEINVAVKALFDAGAGRVAVWDNHGQGKNIDFSAIDARAVRVENPPMKRYERLSFAKNFAFAGIILLGYHSKEGSFNGVLAHTYSSAAIQYYKIGGKTMGEAEIDAYIAGELGIPGAVCRLRRRLHRADKRCHTRHTDCRYKDRQGQERGGVYCRRESARRDL